MSDLDAIRARDATDANITSREAIDAWFVQLRIDVRALLAEVDRLQGKVDRMGEVYEAGEAAQRALALPVIEAARKVVERVLPDSPALYGPEMSDHIRAGNDALTALRATLAEYDGGDARRYRVHV